MHPGLWFIAVGAVASLTHIAVFALLQRIAPQLLPELSNAVGFLVAFAVSFMGHRWLSFKDAGTSVGQSLLRFIVVAGAGFACNEIVFSGLLRYAQWRPMLALVTALVVAAGQTFVLSRWWAFRR
jgi:putative flippase GtrA